MKHAARERNNKAAGDVRRPQDLPQHLLYAPYAPLVMNPSFEMAYHVLHTD